MPLREGGPSHDEALKNYASHRRQHLTDPKNKVYCLGMEGQFWELM